MILISTITCPRCEHRSMESMPEDSCVYRFDCPNCGTELQALKGDCCVFCSYGSVPCPPVQAQQSQR